MTPYRTAPAGVAPHRLFFFQTKFRSCFNCHKYLNSIPCISWNFWSYHVTTCYKNEHSRQVLLLVFCVTLIIVSTVSLGEHPSEFPGYWELLLSHSWRPWKFPPPANLQVISLLLESMIPLTIGFSVSYPFFSGLSFCWNSTSILVEFLKTQWLQRLKTRSFPTNGIKRIHRLRKYHDMLEGSFR